jgi:Fanconi anemia group M protein
VKLAELKVGDYVVSEKVVVERKTARDLAASIIDKRLFSQARDMASAYEKPFFIIEGGDPYTVSGVSPQAVRGSILSLMLDFRIPALLTRDATETALTLVSVAKREQVERGAYISVREKKPPSLPEMQEYVVAGLPHVELTLAKRLLDAFGSVEKVFTATEEELKNVRGIGGTIAQKIREVITGKYSPE